MKVTYIINDISVTYEGSVEEFLKLGVLAAKEETSSGIPEYLANIDTSKIPDTWENVWVAQDGNGDIFARRKKPSIGENWWYSLEMGMGKVLFRSGAGDHVEVVPNWKETLYKYR